MGNPDPSREPDAAVCGNGVGEAGERVCQIQFADIDGWRRAAAASEPLCGIPGCNSVDHDRNGCTQRTAHHSQHRNKAAGAEENPTLSARFQRATHHNKPLSMPQAEWTKRFAPY